MVSACSFTHVPSNYLLKSFDLQGNFLSPGHSDGFAWDLHGISVATLRVNLVIDLRIILFTTLHFMYIKSLGVLLFLWFCMHDIHMVAPWSYWGSGQSVRSGPCLLFAGGTTVIWRCQIKVQFECRAKTKFLAALFQPITSISDYQSVPWSHSFHKMYSTHMCKII